MPTRFVTGTLYRADGATAWASAPVVITPKFGGSYESAGLTATDGTFRIEVPLPTDGNGSYVARFPGDLAVAFTMGQASTDYSIASMIATIASVAPASQAQTLTDGATVAWNTALGRFGILTITANRTMAAPTNLVAGGIYELKVIQDVSGAHTLTWNAVFKWLNGVAPVLSVAGDAVDILRFVSDGTSLWGIPILTSGASSQALTDQATVAWNTALGRFATLTIAASRTMAAPTNLVAGQEYFLKVTQGGAGSFVITWNAVFKWAAGTPPTLTTAPASVDILRFVSDGTNLYGTSVLAVA